MSSDAPRYVQIFNTLSRRMESGRYSVDTRLPTESELCDEFNASRFTVREALRRLVEQGMVQRRQGAGSIVISATPQARYVHSLSSLSDLFQFALETDYELLAIERVTLDAKTAAGVGGSAGEKWHRLKGLRRHEKGGKIVCYLHSYVAPRAGKFVRELKRCVGPFYAHLSERSGEEIIDVEQDIFGVPMDGEMARHLDNKAGAVATCALRRYITRKGTLIASYNWHDAENFYYRMKMSRTI
ncbi:MAG: GntR family transcriptional regulator [Proteobacteria bacterium]|nr:GntR family transcriptional regulator [Pseudomonadota bacterium]